jgi:hypothetical protein
MLASLRGKTYYKIILWIGVLLCFSLTIWLGTQVVTDPKYFPGDDFVEYWAAGRLSLTGGNPYDPEQLHPLELDTGLIEGEPVLWWSPPWVLSIVMPFSIFNYALARTLWLVFSIIILFICLVQLWYQYDGEINQRWLSWLIGFTFIPVLDGLKKGQTSFLLLFGLVGFLYFLSRRKNIQAGVFLSLLLVKPHILYLLFFAAIMWSFSRKKWGIIVGLICSILGSTVLAMLANPQVINQFFYALINFPPDDLSTPTIGGLLRLILGVDLFWLQFLPPVFGMIWMVIYWMKNRKIWRWLEAAPLLVLVSVLTAAYSWSWDQTVSIIAILQIAVLIHPQWRTSRSILIITVYLIIDILLLTVRVNQFWTLWLAPALLLLYLIAQKLLPSSRKDTSSTS